MPIRIVSSRSRASDLDTATAQGAIGLIYYLQNSTPSGRLERLKALFGLGVRIIQLTYNSRNLMGDGCLERTNTGSSKFGVELVARMNAMGILVDLSHSGMTTTLEGISPRSGRRQSATLGAKRCSDHPRNKTDEALKTLADNGGVIGIFQINPYLGGKERNTLDDYVRTSTMR